MNDLRTAAQQALDSINELFAAEQSEGGERGGHIRTPATREHLVRVAQARKALHESCGALRAALAQQDEPVQEPEGLDWRYTARIGYVVKPYTAPPQRKPLTKEEIVALIHPIVMADMPDEMTDYEIARAVEAAHGIKE